METNQELFEQLSAELLEIKKPYLREVNRRQKLNDFLAQCIRAGNRGDFFKLFEMLKSRQLEKVIEDPELEGANHIFEQLYAAADNEVEQYRINFVEDLQAIAQEAELALEIDFPRLSVLKGIEGTVKFAERCTEINGKVVKSVDPKKIVTALVKVKRELYDRPFDPQSFIDNVYTVYKKIPAAANSTVKDSVPIVQFYREYVLSLQSMNFFTNMDKKKFKGYGIDKFAVDFWKYFGSDIHTTSDGKVLKFSSGRGAGLWLIDSDGEKRRFTRISFGE